MPLRAVAEWEVATETTLLLETYLKQLRLPTFLRNYRKVAAEAAHAHLDYDRFRLALAEP